MATKNLTDLLSRQLGESTSHFGFLHHSALPALSRTMAIPLGTRQLPPYSVELGVLRGIEIFSSQNALAASASVWITRWTRGSSNTAFIPDISHRSPTPKRYYHWRGLSKSRAARRRLCCFLTAGITTLEDTFPFTRDWWLSWQQEPQMHHPGVHRSPNDRSRQACNANSWFCRDNFDRGLRQLEILGCLPFLLIFLIKKKCLIVYVGVYAMCV